MHLGPFAAGQVVIAAVVTPAAGTYQPGIALPTTDLTKMLARSVVGHGAFYSSAGEHLEWPGRSGVHHPA